MHAISWASIAVLGLAASAAFAEGEAGDTAPSEQATELTPTAETLLEVFEVASPIRLPDDVPSLAYSEAFTARLPDLEVRRSNAIERLAEIRRLSLLTLAEVGQAQLFFGVSGDGTLGLHFGASSRKQAQDDVRAAELPYSYRPSGMPR